MSSYVMLCNFLPDNFYVILYKSELVLDCVHYFFFIRMSICLILELRMMVNDNA